MNDTFATQAKTALDRQVELAQQLCQLLEYEYEVLKKSDASEITTIGQQKQELVQDLETTTLAWQELLRQNQVEITLPTIEAALVHADGGQPGALIETWASLAEAAKECQRLNTVNGTVLILRQRATEDLLSIVRGTQHTTTYSADGQKHRGPGGGSSIGQA